MKILSGKSGNMDFFNIYKGKRVLITGHTGFKGGWLSTWLHLLGADIYGYALDPLHEQGIYSMSGISSKINDHRGDIKDKSKLSDYVNYIKPDFIFHLAAQPLLLESYKNPVETFEINTLGTVNVLEAIRQCPTVKAGVFITTDKCYENKEWVWGYRENEPMGGHDPYSASKGAAELVISSYRESFFREKGKTAIASARAGNVIGGGDWADFRLVPDIFRAIESGKTIELRNPNATRPWQHVLEPLSGYLLLGAKLFEHPQRFAEAWNFGPFVHEIHSVADVVKEIIKYTGKGDFKDVSDSDKLHEANLLMLDISKANQKLGWYPVLNFKETIQMTSDWYMKFRDTDVFELTKKQILTYQDKWNSMLGN
jgi:CDP-glucose 4,6-dehydratase